MCNGRRTMWQRAAWIFALFVAFVWIGLVVYVSVTT
jgi:hypothetical protein